MPYTVNACFDKFRKEIVDLDPEITKIARGSRDFVLKNIRLLSEREELPKLYDGMSLNFGSFERKTKKRELDDIDMMVCFSGTGGTYNTVVENEEYRITFDSTIPVIEDCLDDNGYLNSRKVVNKVISALEGVEHYKKAEMHRDHEAARLQLSSYTWNFDIVPSFYTVSGFYLIPDGYGNWKNTDPRIDKRRITEANQKNYCLLLPLIRLMKYWKSQKWGEAISSYMFEQMVIDFVDTCPIQAFTSWQTRVSQVLEYLWKAIYNPVWDPKGIQGDLNDLDVETKKNLSMSAYMSLLSATQAIKFESIGETQKAIKQWSLIFGNKFPEYGRD